MLFETRSYKTGAPARLSYGPSIIAYGFPVIRTALKTFLLKREKPEMRETVASHPISYSEIGTKFFKEKPVLWLIDIIICER